MKFFLSLLIAILFVIPTIAQEAQFPIIESFGGIYKIEGATSLDSQMEYKIVIDLKTLQRDKESINPGLNNVARMMNLHGLGGVNAENLDVAVIVHGGATDIIINNEAYQKRYELDNPNIELIATLKEAGVNIYVCGQSLLSRQYARNEVNEDVIVALSMLTTFTTYMHNGYVPLVFN
ncbi:MAG: DsrE family protein [bacterium]|nr:DsrE family protein [bacterium]